MAARRKGAPRPGPFWEDWLDFRVSVRQAIQRSVNPPPGQKIIPYDRPESVLKRMVYHFVLKYHREKKFDYLVDAIIFQRDTTVPKLEYPLRVDFKDNPFHWILMGLVGEIEVFEKFKINKTDASRYSQQLIYAYRHEVPPEYLIGFLYQSGTLIQVCEKAKYPKQSEDWFIAQRRQREHGGK